MILNKSEKFGVGVMQAARLESIMNIIAQNKSVKVSELSERLGVTEKTIRQDLNKLKDMNMVSRVHGGAMIQNDVNEIFPVSVRKTKNFDIKERLARAAAAMIEDGDVIILDSGSTVLPMTQYIEKNVIVITNDLYVANRLLGKSNVSLYMIGGQLNPQSNSSYNFIGKASLAMLQRCTANKAFIGTSAVNFKRGLMVFSDAEAEMKRAMIETASQVIVLADHSKFNKSAFSSFATLDDIDMMIVDSSITRDEILALNAHKITVKTI